MLVILHRLPVATPSETMLDKESVEQVALHNLIRIRLTAVCIRHTVGGRDQLSSVSPHPHIMIITCVDVDSHPHGVLGEFLRARHITVTETGGVIVTHRLLIISTVFINQTNLLYRILCLVEFPEDLHKILGNGFVADEFTLMHLPLRIHMEHPHMAQVTTGHGATLRIRETLHPRKEGVAERSRRKILCL